jgi:hypothetical protein
MILPPRERIFPERSLRAIVNAARGARSRQQSGCIGSKKSSHDAIHHEASPHLRLRGPRH